MKIDYAATISHLHNAPPKVIRVRLSEKREGLEELEGTKGEPSFGSFEGRGPPLGAQHLNKVLRSPDTTAIAKVDADTMDEEDVDDDEGRDNIMRSRTRATIMAKLNAEPGLI